MHPWVWEVGEVEQAPNQQLEPHGWGGGRTWVVPLPSAISWAFPEH